MKVLTCKIHRAPIKRIVDGEEEVRFMKIGLYMEFDDGQKIVAPNGRTYTGRGTVARFNFRHCTWSVTAPERFRTCKMGYFFDSFGVPVLEKPQGFTGLSHERFISSFGRSFVNMCLGNKICMGV